MKLPKYASRLAQIGGENKLLALISLFSLVSNLLLVIWLFNVDTREKTIITPPVLKQSFWVHGEHLAPEYLTEMADWFTGLATTYNAQNARSRTDLLLRYVHPSKHGALASRMEKRLQDIERYREGSVLYVREILVNKQNVALLGEQRRHVGGRQLENRDVAYRVEFRYENGRLSVWDLLEVDPNAPFDPVVADPSGD